MNVVNVGEEARMLTTSSTPFTTVSEREGAIITSTLEARFNGNFERID